MTEPVSRRTVLRGLGVAMSLPWLEGMAPSRAAAAELPGGVAPVRLGFVFMPNGVNYQAWLPEGIAAPAGVLEASVGFALSPTLQPLAAVHRHVSLVTGLTLKKARANGDGPGDHARSSASFLTGSQARKTAGNDIRLGVSVDQVAAGEVGDTTRLPSIELGCEHGPSAGSCDSGYSCAYSSNISWRDEKTPMAKVIDPAQAFERLFGDAMAAAAARERLSRRKSILDFVMEDTRALSKRLGAADKQKLEQYQAAVREVEKRVERARADSASRKMPEVKAPAGVPDKVSEHMDLMFDMLHLAFQTDSTRVGTLMLAVDGSNRPFPEIGVKEGHHHLSHHENNKEMIEKIRKIDRFHVERFARFVKKMADTPDAGGRSLLDNSLIVLGGGISDGNKHNHEDLPILLAGRGGGVESGRLLRTKRETPLCNLYVAMLQKAGVRRDAFSDSTGVLAI
ncbi:MAG: DUF1552 domain-containing protein [Phycisphaerales bacterium]|nr:DUF1552 domain-containing protein [Phycisphaerales bacterium]